jgi:hypothetical protein
MQPMAQSFCISGPPSSGSTGIKTTLYELIEAVTEEINPGEEHWISLIVDHMLCSGKSILSHR